MDDVPGDAGDERGQPLDIAQLSAAQRVNDRDQRILTDVLWIGGAPRARPRHGLYRRGEELGNPRLRRGIAGPYPDNEVSLFLGREQRKRHPAVPRYRPPAATKAPQCAGCVLCPRARRSAMILT